MWLSIVRQHEPTDSLDPKKLLESGERISKHLDPETNKEDPRIPMNNPEE